MEEPTSKSVIRPNISFGIDKLEPKLKSEFKGGFTKNKNFSLSKINPDQVLDRKKQKKIRMISTSMNLRKPGFGLMNKDKGNHLGNQTSVSIRDPLRFAGSLDPKARRSQISNVPASFRIFKGHRNRKVVTMKQKNGNEKKTIDQLLGYDKVKLPNRIGRKGFIAAMKDAHKPPSSKRVPFEDENPLSKKNINRMIKSWEENTSSLYLTVDKKRRVFEAFDDGLSKYLPKKKVKNFSMLIQMVEKLMDSKETFKTILEKLDPPKGRSYRHELREEARQKRKEKIQAELQHLRTTELEELEHQKKQNEAKEVFLNSRKSSNIEVEEVKLTSRSPKEVTFYQDEFDTTKTQRTAKARFHPSTSHRKETSATSKTRKESCFSNSTKFRLKKINNEPLYKRSGVYTPGLNFSEVNDLNPGNRAATSLNTKRKSMLNRDINSNCSYRIPPFDKDKFLKELKEKEDRKMKQSTRTILSMKDKLEKELLNYKLDGAAILNKKSDQKVEQIQKDNKRMREAIDAYIDLMEIGERDDITLQDMINEHQETKLTSQEINHFKGENRVISLFLKKQGRRKLWKPDRFATSRRVKIAESFDQLIG
ncbi:unnamed protein product [Moneuplotes crassus]|uniref:Uncharacterized protein n=1 Tax=Euplotes crassus TaxID=5936 RepID=A0AAD1X2J8_EUPCR|nr:unnamed protein product [Moneuplotes crassus]